MMAWRLCAFARNLALFDVRVAKKLARKDAKAQRADPIF
jgi:hypothetical protein